MPDHQGSLAVALSAASAVLCLSAAAIAAPTTTTTTDSPLSPTAIYTLSGQTGGALGSAAVAGHCNVTGDDKASVITTDWWWSRGAHDMVGAAYVAEWNAWHTATSPQPIDDEDRGVRRIEGSTGEGNTLFGFSIDCLGDSNGDGIDDLVIADFIANRAVVIFGDRNFPTQSLDYLGTHGYFINGPQSGRSGTWARGIGDINGDGLTDIAVPVRSNPTVIHVIAGADDIATVQLPSPSRTLMTITGNTQASPDQATVIGDINGDGIDDFAVASYAGTSEEAAANSTKANGVVWVIYGTNNPQDIDLSQPLDNRGFRISGPIEGRDRLGMSVTRAGDLNGDGFADFVLGADSLRGAGGAVVVWGSATNPGSLTTNFSPAAPASVTDANGASHGIFIRSPQETNGAGYATAVIPASPERSGVIAIGAYNADTSNGTSSGAVYLISTLALPQQGSISISDLPATQAITIEGDFAGQRLGRSVSAPGDINGDGNPDVAWGADAIRAGQPRMMLGLLGELPANPTSPSDEDDSPSNPTDNSTPVVPSAKPDQPQDPRKPSDDVHSTTNKPNNSKKNGVKLLSKTGVSVVAFSAMTLTLTGLGIALRKKRDAS